MSDEIQSVIVEPIFEAETLDIFNERNRSFVIAAGVIATTDANYLYKPKFAGKLHEAVLFDDAGKRLIYGDDFVVDHGYLLISGRPAFPLELAYEHMVNVHTDQVMPIWTGIGTTPIVPNNIWINAAPNTIPAGGLTYGPTFGSGGSFTGGVPTWSGTSSSGTSTAQSMMYNTSNGSSVPPLVATGTLVTPGTMDNYLEAKAAGWSISGTRFAGR